MLLLSRIEKIGKIFLPGFLHAIWNEIYKIKLPKATYVWDLDLGIERAQ